MSSKLIFKLLSLIHSSTTVVEVVTTSSIITLVVVVSWISVSFIFSITSTLSSSPPHEKSESSKIKSILYLSSTSVYGDHNGAWVNEESETKPKTKMGIDRLHIENKWIEFSKKKKLPIQIFRLAGIYSEKNNAVSRLQNKQSFLVVKENHFFSRIHVKDISEILYLSLINIKENQIFNLADNKPASSVEVTSYASKLLGCELPTKINFEDLEDSVLKDFYRDSKKVSNEKVKKELNYEFIYPSYKEGLAQ